MTKTETTQSEETKINTTESSTETKTTLDDKKTARDFLQEEFKDNREGLDSAIQEFEQTGTFSKGLEEKFDIFRGKVKNEVPQEEIIQEETKIKPVEEVKTEETEDIKAEEVTPTTEKKQEEIKPKEEIKAEEVKIETTQKEDVKKEKETENILTVTETEQFAKDQGIDYTKSTDGTVTFSPKNTSQALDLYIRYGTGVKVDSKSISAIRASADYAAFSKYRGADSNTLFNGLKSGELSVGGETWENIKRTNGGELTEQMLIAQEQFNTFNKTKLNNLANNDIFNQFSGKDSQSMMISLYQGVNELLNKSNASYSEALNKTYSSIKNTYNETLGQDSEYLDLNKKKNAKLGELDKLETQRQNKLKDIKSRYPKASLTFQLRKARQETQDINDRIFELDSEIRTLNSDIGLVQGRVQASYDSKIKAANLDIENIKFTYQNQLAQINNIKEFGNLLVTAKKDQETLKAQYDNFVKKADYENALRIKEKQVAASSIGNFNSIGNSLWKENEDGSITVIDLKTKESTVFGSKTELNNSTIKDSNGNAVEISTPITNGTGAITQGYGDTSLITYDNVTLANGQKGTPGIDIDGYAGDDIQSYTTGTVVKVVTGKGRSATPSYGNQVIIRDSKGNLHMYNHLQNVNVKKGDKITRGDSIATMGFSGSTIATGVSDGSHLDYRVSANGKIKLNEAEWIDPNQFIQGGGTIKTKDTFPIITAEELAQLDTAKETKNKSDWSKEDRDIANKINLAERKFEEKFPEYTGILPTAMSVGAGVSDADRDFLLQGANKAMREGNLDDFKNTLNRIIKISGSKQDSPYANIGGFVETKAVLDTLLQLSKDAKPNAIKSGLVKAYGLIGQTPPNLDEIVSYKSFLQSNVFEQVLKFAGTSFTEGTVDKIEELYPKAGDTPEQVENKIKGLLTQANVGLKRAKNIIDPRNEGIFEEIFPELTGGDIETSSVQINSKNNLFNGFNNTPSKADYLFK